MKIQDFFTSTDGKAVKLYSLRNRKGFGADITDMGGALVSIFAPSRDGKMLDVLLKHENPADYEPNKTFYGALIGRVANRISFGKLVINGKEYQLPINDNHNRPNMLHGGKCYGRRLWNAEVIDDATLQLTLVSPDGDAGFPGNLKVKVVYHVTENNEIEIDYQAVTDAETVVNFTNHAYFNLNGETNIYCNDHFVTSKAYARTEVNDVLAPTGKLLPLAGTGFDLAKGRTFAEVCADPSLAMTYDDNFVIADKAGTMQKNVFTVVSPSTGIRLEVDTDQPGIQFYMAPEFDEPKCQNLKAFCLEAQCWPDAPTHPNFPSIALKPGETYRQKTVYRFSVDR